MVIQNNKSYRTISKKFISYLNHNFGILTHSEFFFFFLPANLKQF